MRKILHHNIYKERHELTKQLRLDMFDMKNAKTKGIVDYYEGRMLGMTAAYWWLGFIDMKARNRYIEIIVEATFKRRREIFNEV